MAEKQTHNPRLVIPVTQEEYEQFLRDKTYLPDCLHVDGLAVPDCSGGCPKGLVCATFVFVDMDQGVETEWYACAPAEAFAQLLDRAVQTEEARNGRKPKYITYSL